MDGFVKDDRQAAVSAGDHHERLLWLLLAGQLVVWTVIPSLVHRSPPLDVVESFIWGQELVAATFKHPNGPGLLLELGRTLTFGGLWVAPLISQLCIAAAFWAVYELGKMVLPAGRALTSAALLTGVYYYSWPTPEFNHNVLQIPFWALLWLSSLKAVRTGRMAWWVVLGAAGAAAMWAKYSSVLALITVLLWLAMEPRGRAAFRTAGPYLAATVFLLGVLPQIAYLLRTDFLPLTYLSERSGGSGSGALSFLGAQIVDHLPFLIVLSATGLLGRGMALSRQDPSAGLERRFLLVAGLMPLGLTMVLGVTGMNLKSMWGAPMFNLSGLLFLAFLGGRWTPKHEKRVLVAAAILLTVVPLGYLLNHVVAVRTAQKPLRTQYPMETISETFAQLYRDETGAPLRLVAGDIFSAGLIALGQGEGVTVVTDGDPIKASWVDPGTAEREGALIVWASRRTPAGTLSTLVGDRPVRELDVQWSKNEEVPPLRYSYVVLPPQEKP